MAEKETVADDATDESLSRAWESSEPEVKEEPTEPVAEEHEEEFVKPDQTPEKASSAGDKEPVDDLDHKEKSKLGRKLKGMEDRYNLLLEEVERLKSQGAKTSDEIEVPSVISSPDDIDKYLQAKSQKEHREKREYEGSYMKQINALKEMNDDLHEDIFAEMMANFNVRHSSNAFADARINYAEAKASILSKKFSSGEKLVPKRETSGKPPVTPAAGSSRAASKVASLPKLDDDAQNFVSYLRAKGMSDDDIAKELA